jgi:hypothetical protein
MQATTSCDAGVGLGCELPCLGSMHQKGNKEAWDLFDVIPAQQPLRACLDDANIWSDDTINIHSDQELNNCDGLRD